MFMAVPCIVFKGVICHGSQELFLIAGQLVDDLLHPVIVLSQSCLPVSAVTLETKKALHRKIGGRLVLLQDISPPENPCLFAELHGLPVPGPGDQVPFH